MAADAMLVRATAEHAALLAPSMRPEDAAEVLASGGYSPLEALLAALDASELARALIIDDQVVAIAGVARAQGPTLLGGEQTGIVWLLTGSGVAKRPLTFLRLCRPFVDELLARFDVLVNAIDARYATALRWAAWLGFDVQSPRPFGVQGLPFHPIVLRRPHV